MRTTAYNFWKRIRDFATKKMEKAYIEPVGCDSCCPKCKQWESHGNRITTEPHADGTDLRKCENCEHSWLAIFTPAGFIQVDKKERNQ